MNKEMKAIEEVADDRGRLLVENGDLSGFLIDIFHKHIIEAIQKEYGIAKNSPTGFGFRSDHKSISISPSNRKDVNYFIRFYLDTYAGHGGEQDLGYDILKFSVLIHNDSLDIHLVDYERNGWVPPSEKLGIKIAELN